jgi:1,4-dihydroxy-2-naphthoate polyprenyltransferase
LYTHKLDWKILFPASSIGLLSVAVLNLNNMRDVENDKKNKKNTLVVKLGIKKTKFYHSFLIITPFFLSTLFVIFNYKSIFGFTFLILIIPCIFHLKKVFQIKNNKEFDPELKKIAILTLFYSFLIGFFNLKF